ncbi:MAG: hypothetical protein E7655_06730 [Ruminococcaceae bacterium]|nr:hypothetical protein [Oscillospiraceae bacterium]
MRGKKRDAFLSWLMSLGLSLAMRLEWSIPAWILLACHFWLGLPIWWFWLAIAAWILPIVIRLAILRWASSCGQKTDPPKENKNPYSKH